MHQRPASRRTDVHRRIEVQESSRPHSPPPSRRAEGRRPAPSPNCQGLTARRFSCAGRLGELTRFFRWLDQRHVTALAHVDTHTCEAYLAFRRYILDDNGTVVGEQGPSVRRVAAQIVVDLVNYRDLLTADRVRPDVRPWGGASASAVAEMRSGRDGNTTPADNDEILQPKLAAALHLVQVLGPHAITLKRTDTRIRPGRRGQDHTTAPHYATRRGHPDGVGRLHHNRHTAAPTRRPRTADGATRPWSPPLHRSQAVAVVGIVRTAAIIVLAASSGMRSSELMELRVGCRRPIEEPIPGLKRYRIDSKIVKGQPFGGTDDEWVVIEPAFRAVELAEQLHPDPGHGVLLFSRFAFTVRYAWFRNWVNSPPGQRLGLAPIPEGSVSLRMLRRMIALELAYHPGGVLAAKLQLKQIATATTEGYAARPGGAQAELLSEVNEHEADRNLDLVLAEFRNYQQGILPAGPAPAALPRSSPASTPRSLRRPRPRQRPSTTIATSSTCSPNAPRPCTWARRTTAGSPTRPARSASKSPAPRPPTVHSSECVTRPAAPKPPTTPPTGRSGPSTPSGPRPSSANSARPAPPNTPVCAPITTVPCASSPRSTSSRNA
jgi:integrase